MITEPKRNKYVGHRYVPLIMGEWNKEQSYEGLSIVTYEGSSYTSKKRVPVGIDILNEEYWAVTGNYNAQIDQYRKDVREVQNDLENIKYDVGKNTQNIIEIMYDLYDRGVNVLNPPEGYEPAVGDGIHDDTQAIQSLINDFDIVLLPMNRIYRTTDTIKVAQRRKRLIGLGIPSGSGTSVAEIRFDGVEDRKKAVVLLGQNNVGDEPTIDTSGIIFQNVLVNANWKAGFGVYGTYITNETIVDNIIVKHSLEYNMYFARGWYASLTNLTSKNCKGKGLAFGMPLIFQSGEKVTWTTKNSLELNNVKIDNVRSISSGEYYSKDHVGVFDPRNNNHNIHGYGIGAGIGNGFRMENFLSESSGGINLYTYTSSQPSKNISKGYLENANLNGSIEDPKEKCNMLIENIYYGGDSYYIEDIFMNYNSGGIYHKGNTRPVWLKNVHQPRFLRSLEEGITSHDLYSFVLKENVYYDCGYSNTLNSLGTIIARKRVDTRYSWEIPVLANPGGYVQLYAKLVTDEQPIGSFGIELENGTVTTSTFKELTNEYTYVRQFTGDAVRIFKSGETADYSAEIDIKLVSQPATYI